MFFLLSAHDFCPLAAHYVKKKTDGEIVCFFNCENGLLRKPYVLFLVKFWSAFKAQLSSTDDKGHTKNARVSLRRDKLSSNLMM